MGDHILLMENVDSRVLGHASCKCVVPGWAGGSGGFNFGTAAAASAPKQNGGAASGAADDDDTAEENPEDKVGLENWSFAINHQLPCSAAHAVSYQLSLENAPENSPVQDLLLSFCR